MRMRSLCTVTHSLTCAGNVHKQQLVVLACFSGWGRRGDIDPVTSKVLGHSPPPPPPLLRSLLLLPPLTPPSHCRNVADADDVTSFPCSPSFGSSTGTGQSERQKKRVREIKRRMACTVHLPFTITTLGSAVRLNWLPQRRNACRPSNRVIQQPPG